MNYVKSCLIITMLLGIGYGQDCDPEASVGWNCDCNEDTWQEYYNSENHIMDGCYLFEANLGGEHLYEADLSYANLGGAHLYEANLSFANLSWAGLVGADLSFADLSGASLTGTDLMWANLSNTNFTDAFCWGAFFVNATLDGTNFEGADLTYAYFDENEDYYEDMSYDAGAESGDLNLDGVDNVLDVVILVNNILNP